MKNLHADKAYVFVRERILSGEFPPGLRLRAVVLANKIGISRTPLRDALRQLEIEGLVDIQARLGARVRSVNIEEYRELCELRLALEALAAELAARNCNYAELGEIQSALEAMERLSEEIDHDPDSFRLYQDLVEEDIRFHFAIFAAAHNKLIKQEIMRLHVLNRVINIGVCQGARPESLQEAKRQKTKQPKPAESETRSGWKPLTAERRKVILDFHRNIFAAIRDRQPEAARAAMHAHISELLTGTLASANLNPKLELPPLNREELHHAPYS